MHLHVAIITACLYLARRLIFLQLGWAVSSSRRQPHYSPLTWTWESFATGSRWLLSLVNTSWDSVGGYMDAPSQNCFAKLASCSEQPVNTSNPGEQISWDSFSEQGLFLGPVSMVTQDASLSSFAPPPPENCPFGNCHKQSLSFLVIWGSSSACGPGFCRGHSLGGPVKPRSQSLNFVMCTALESVESS